MKTFFKSFFIAAALCSQGAVAQDFLDRSNPILPSDHWQGGAMPYEVEAIVFNNGTNYWDYERAGGKAGDLVGTPTPDAAGRQWYEPEYNAAGFWTISSPITGEKFATDDIIADIYFRRHFTLTESLEGAVILTYGHDDGPVEVYINGVLIVALPDANPDWNRDEHLQLSPEQMALIKTDGSDNVLAMHVHQDWGGSYADCGLYRARENSISADFSTWEEFPLLKKIGVYQTPHVSQRWLDRDLPRLADLESRSYRYEMACGQGVYGQPVVQNGTKPIYNFRTIDKMFDLAKENTESFIFSHCYTPTFLIPSGRDHRAAPNDLELWGEINGGFTNHWREKGYLNSYVEIWNEPDLDWAFTGTQAEYHEMYRYAANAVREADPDVKVGGPATAIATWHNNFAQFVADNKLPLDFMSGHAYSEDAMWQINTMRDALRKVNNNEAEILITEYSSIGLDGIANHEGGVSEQAEAAMRLFSSIDHFLRCHDVTHINWAQFIDAQNLSNGDVLHFGQGDKIGLIEGVNGNPKSLFNALSLYGSMPLCRRKLTIDGGLQGLASSDDERVTVALWNRSYVTAPFELQLQNIPFATGTLEVYHIDTEHNSWFETGSGELLPERVETVEISNGTVTLNDLVAKRGVYFVRITAPGAGEPFAENKPARTIRTRYYYRTRTEESVYGHFDSKTWTAYLSTNGQNTTPAYVGVEADQLPGAFRVETIATDGFNPTNKNASFNVRFDFQTAEGYTKGVLFHGGCYNEARSRHTPWGTTKKPDQVVEVADFSDFLIRLSDYAPEGFTGRIVITFELGQVGLNQHAIVHLSDATAAGFEAIKGSATPPSAAGTYNLLGQRVSNSHSHPGLYIQNGKKFFVR